MTFLFYYRNPIENFSIYSSFVFFLFFALYVLVKKTASGRNSYSKVNRIHQKIFLLYLISFFSYILIKKEINISALIGLLVGSFIYFSLYYVYFFSLIGLVKKSISINILVSIKELELQKRPINEENLSAYMNAQKIGIGDIRESRLQQMTNLGFATLDDSKYQISPFGKLVHQVGTIILKTWNQKRL